MAKRNRYRALEKLMTEILLGDVLVFILFLVFSSKGLNVLRVITATLSLLASVLSVGWLFITGELLRRRSFWMVTGFSSIFLCLIISLILKYPCPPVA